ncbi:MAG: TonB-dependent siderophore receptor [Cyanobacteria bacterium P01_B01_bin.77]
MFGFWMRLGTVSPLVAVFLVSALPALANQPRSSLSHSVDELYVQNNPIVITNVQINSLDDGAKLILETDGELSEPVTSISGNTLTSDISNAVLALPEAGDFSVDDPTESISQITITNLTDNQVRVEIVGNETVPSINISSSINELVLTVVTDSVPIDLADDSDNVLRIVVTGEETNNYRVTNASTATRTDTPILDVPQSIQVVTQQVLKDQNIIRVDDALRNVSGVVGTIAPFGSSSNITLRGFSTGNFNNGPILRDGFRIRDNFSSQEITNVERIEVIKGPSSVLYGQSDPGGLINLVTKRPSPTPFYELEFQGGSFGLVRPSLDASGPLTEDLAYRLNVSYQHRDSYRDYTTDTERLFIAPVLSWDISDRTTLSLLLEYNDEEIPLDAGLPAFGTRVVDVPRDRIQNEPDNLIRNDTLNLGYDLKHQFSDDWSFNHGFRYFRQDYFILADLIFGADETTGDITRFFGDRNYISDDYSFQTSVVGDFETGTIDHTLLAGFDLSFNRFEDKFTRVDFTSPTILNIFNPVYGPPRPDLSTVTPFTSETEADRISIFLQDQITFSDEFILVGSLRYDSVKSRNLTADTSRFAEAVSPRVGLIYKPLETVSLYANYAQSFEPNTSTDAQGETFDPEEGNGFEVGVKAELLDGDLLATLAYFDITKQNVTTADPNNMFFSIATGEQRSQGIELDIAGEILPGWNIIANYAYTDARITEDNTNPVGNRLFNVPRHSANLWTTYEIQQGDLQGLGFGGGFNYVGQRQGDLANSFEVDNYFLTNAALFYKRDNWRLGLNFNNIFDVNYISATGARIFSNVSGAPFSVVGSVSVTF